MGLLSCRVRCLNFRLDTPKAHLSLLPRVQLPTLLSHIRSGCRYVVARFGPAKPLFTAPSASKPTCLQLGLETESSPWSYSSSDKEK